MRKMFIYMVGVRKPLIALIIIVLWPVFTYGETIFSDNFDSCSTNCTVNAGGTPPNSAGWASWHQGGISETVGGVTHYSGEITSPGYGGVGKSLKMWRADGVFGDYTGTLRWEGYTGQTHFFMSYHIKIPTAFKYTGNPGGTGFKSWRLMTNSEVSGKHEIYLNFNTYGDTWSIHDGGSGWTTMLSGSQKSVIWDGNWHFIEWEFGFDTNVLRLWVDSVLKYEDTKRAWNVTGGLRGIQHFNIGNTFDHNGTWQTGWQAMEVDNFVLSTTYVAPVSGGGEPPPLGKQPNPPAKLQLR